METNILKEKSLKELEQLNIQLNEYLVQKEKQEEYKKYDTIFSNSQLYDGIKKRYEFNLKEQNDNDNNERKLISYKSQIQKDMAKQGNKQIELNKAKYINIKIDEELIKLELEKQKLEKHPIKKAIKSKSIKERMNELKKQRQNEQNRYNSKKSNELSQIEADLQVLKISLEEVSFELNEVIRKRNYIEQEFENINEEIKLNYYCDDINKVEKMIEEAKEYLSTHKKVKYDYFIDSKIYNITEQIKQIEEKLEEFKNKRR